MSEEKKFRDNDGLFVKRGIWQFKVRVGPRRYKQVSTGTTNKNQARSFRLKYLQEFQEGKLPTDVAKWPFQAYADQWLADRALRIRASTKAVFRFRLAHLKAFFSGYRLCEITIQDIRRYQQDRRKKVSAGTVNLETRVLRYLLRSAKLWSRLADDFEGLKEEGTEPRVLTPAEERKLFQVGSGNPDWFVAYNAAILANNTTCRSCEIRGLRLRNVDLTNRTISIGRSSTKTDAGVRKIALNEEAFQALTQLWKRAQALGSSDPDHYLLPRQKRDKKFDPGQPQETWEKAWRKMVEAAGLKGLRFHDLRHNANTALAEDPEVSAETRIAIAGHSSLDSNANYTHPRVEATRRALERLEERRKQLWAELELLEQAEAEASSGPEAVN